MNRAVNTTRYRQLKKRIYEIIGPAVKGDTASIVFDIVLCTLVLASSAAVFIDLFNLLPDWQEGLIVFEHITVAIFIAEYLVRLWVCEYAYPECSNKFEAIKEYVTSFDSLIDLLSIFSIVFNQIPKDFAILRLVKLIKLVRLVKLSEHIHSEDQTNQTIQKIQIRTNEILDKGKDGDKLSKTYDILTITLILLSVSFILVETFPVPDIVHTVLFYIESGIAVLFSVEYVLRVWTAPLDYPNLRPDKARMHYIFSFMSLIDLLSIIPIFVANIPNATGILKIFKLCKILRLLKASRYLRGVANFGKAIQSKKKQILLSIISICVMIMICSVLMYSFENKEQPEVFNNGFSGVIYSFMVMMGSEADIAPVTPIGQGLSTVMLLLGGCMFGVPVAIVATGFEDMISEQAGEEDEEADLYELLKQYDSLDNHQKQKVAAYIKADSVSGDCGDDA